VRATVCQLNLLAYFSVRSPPDRNHQLTALSKYEEERLLLSVAAGDETAFTQIYSHYHPGVYPYVLKLVKVPQLAEDIVQDVFLKIWEARGQLPQVKNFPGYLFTVARNHTLNILRSIARSNHALAALIRHFQEQRVDDAILNNDYRRFIEHALQRIPERSREIFRKCRDQAMTYEEVAVEMGISRNAVKKHMVKAIRILKDATRGELNTPTATYIALITLLSLHLR
jgi:RNA polymerase sigma-70 factor (family 1)